MTDPTAAELDAICARLTKAQQWLVTRLPASWTAPGDIGAKPNHTGNRDRALIEASHEGARREYRLTSLGVATRKRLIERMNG